MAQQQRTTELRSFGASSIGERYTMRSRYMEAMREGPARIPDHILINHPQFNCERPSPYMIYFYDVTAPNPVLLENDCTRDARIRGPKRIVTTKYWTEEEPMEYMTTGSHQSSKSSRSSKEQHRPAHDDRKRNHSKYESKTSYATYSSGSSTSGRSDSSGSSYSYSYSSDEYSSSSEEYYKSKKGPHCPALYSSQASEHEPDHERSVLIHPDLRRSKKRDLRFVQQELVFNAYQSKKDAGFEGTLFSHLPQYSTSYKNYPYIAFDVLHPRNYNEFFNERNSPGFFTAHRPTSTKVQGRRPNRGGTQ